MRATPVGSQPMDAITTPGRRRGRTAGSSGATNASPISESAVDEFGERLLAACAAVGRMVVAFSGGVDSALLGVAAQRAVPGSVLLVTADSASLGAGELDRCRAFAARWSLPWQAATTAELLDDRYVANDADRCYWCKTALMDRLEPIAQELGATVVLGVNTDDLGDHRPGQRAAAERGARFPMVDAGLAKADVRALARHWELEVWDRPAMPCLSSRIPYGTAVSVPLLGRIDRAESAVRALGFRDVRVRHYGDTARIELPAGDLVRAASLAGELVDVVCDAGYRYVTLDMAGLRSGNLNDRSATP